MVSTMKTYYPNILTVTGVGRKVGKTTLACAIISKLASEQKITAVKISMHFHDVDYKNCIKEKQGDFVIYQEDRTDRGKDSARMLAAGAGKVYYVQTRDSHLQKAWDTLEAFLDKQRPVIVESGGINDIIQPGVALLVSHAVPRAHAAFAKQKITNHIKFSAVIPGNESIESVLNRISFSEGKWNL
jgi:molybdopterin-guanine dinucleotide biosynthesis protein